MAKDCYFNKMRAIVDFPIKLAKDCDLNIIGTIVDSYYGVLLSLTDIV